MRCGAADRWEFRSQRPATAIPMCAQTKAPVNDAIVNWYSNGEVVSMSLSHQDSCQEDYSGCVLGHFREAI